MEAVDPYTVKFTLAEPNAAFLGNLTSNYGAIVDKDVIAEKGDLMRADGGTGPFQLGEWLPDNYVTITKFSDYWEADPVRPRRLLMHKREILRLFAKVKQDGYALVPLCIYFKGPRIKLEVGLCKGKKLYDKREDMARRAAKRDMERALKERNIS